MQSKILNHKSQIFPCLRHVAGGEVVGLRSLRVEPEDDESGRGIGGERLVGLVGLFGRRQLAGERVRVHHADVGRREGVRERVAALGELAELDVEHVRVGEARALDGHGSVRVHAELVLVLAFLTKVGNERSTLIGRNRHVLLERSGNAVRLAAARDHVEFHQVARRNGGSGSGEFELRLRHVARRAHERDDLLAMLQIGGVAQLGVELHLVAVGHDGRADADDVLLVGAERGHEVEPRDVGGLDVPEGAVDELRRIL